MMSTASTEASEAVATAPSGRPSAADVGLDLRLVAEKPELVKAHLVDRGARSGSGSGFRIRVRVAVMVRFRVRVRGFLVE